MHRPHSYNQSFLYPFVLFPPFFSLSLSFISFTFSLFLPLFLTPSHPTQPLSASLRSFFFFQPSISTPGATVCIHRLPWQPEEATWAGGWTKDPETLIHRESERARDGEWEGEREREREGKSDFIFRRGVWCVWKMRRWRRMERRRGGGMDSVGEVSS